MCLSLCDIAQLTAILNFCRPPAAAPKTSDSRRPLYEMAKRAIIIRSLILNSKNMEHESPRQEEYTPEMEAKLAAEGFHVEEKYDRNDQEGLNRYNKVLEQAQQQGKEYRTTYQGNEVKLWVK